MTSNPYAFVNETGGRGFRGKKSPRGAGPGGRADAAVRLLQLRQMARTDPERPACEAEIEPLFRQLGCGSSESRRFFADPRAVLARGGNAGRVSWPEGGRRAGLELYGTAGGAFRTCAGERNGWKLNWRNVGNGKGVMRGAC